MKNYKKEEIEFENKIASQYNEWYNDSAISQSHNHNFVKYIQKELRPGFKVLDLGCGPATLWVYWEKIKNIEFIGVDISPKMIKEAKKSFPRGKFKVADSENLPFKNETFDAVVASSVLHHLPSPDKSFKEIGRILKPYGLLIGREPQQKQFINLANPSLSGAIMSLIHLVRRREQVIPPKEPPIHKYHKTFQIKDFSQSLLKNYLHLKELKSMYPFSSAFVGMKNKFGAKMILWTDRAVKKRYGNQFYYKAIKYGYERKDVIFNINEYLNVLDQEEKKPAIKLAKILVLIAIVLDLILPKK